MRMKWALVLMVLAVPMTQAQQSGDLRGEPPGDLPRDITELSPDLYLLTHRARMEGEVDAQLGAINRANEFARSRGGVAVPLTGQLVQDSLTLKVYQYQFRVMSREQALAARPVLAAAVITVNNTGTCAPNAAVTALLPDLHGTRQLDGLDLLARLPEPPSESTPATNRGETPGAICMPGTLCKPSQLCLPGWQCSPGTLPTPEPPPAG
jgi:hypothetical protein